MVDSHIDACPPRQPNAKEKVEAKVKLGRGGRIDSSHRRHDGLKGLQVRMDAGINDWARQATCPATSQTVAENWRRELKAIRPLPLLPEPFDVVVTRRLEPDCLVAFEGEQYAVPVAPDGQQVAIRSCAGVVQILPDDQVLKQYARGTAARLLIEPDCFEGEAIEPVMPPTPLGRMDRKLQEIFTMPVATRPIDLYAALAEEGGQMSPAKAAPTKTGRVSLDRTRESHLQLGLKHGAERAAELLPEAVKTEAPAHQFLDRLLGEEIRQRGAAPLDLAPALAAPHRLHALADFAWAVQPSVDKSRIETLATCAWIRDREKALIQDPSGVARTHLGVTLGVKAVENGFSAVYFRLDNLLHALKEDAGVSPQQLRRNKYIHVALLVIDEIDFSGSIAKKLASCPG